jgi:2-C-methyl-D-erythritol 2,4-cyclodiphosphate synthase
METRVGIGYDSHKFVYGRKLFIGGVNIPFELGLHGHSDGDVLIHSVIDALLGASGLPDIGTLFPNSDPAFKDIDSKILLAKTYNKLQEANVQIANIDAVLILEQPKLAPYYSSIRDSLSGILNISSDKISIKAKTNEGMGFIGKGEGIASIVVAMIEKL